MGFGWVWVPSTRVQVPIQDAQVQMWPYLFWCFHQKLWNEPISPWLELNQVPSPCSITVLRWMKWGDCLTLGPCTHLWNKAHSTNWYWEWSFVVQLFSHVTLWDPHGLQHTRLPCPSLSPGACSNSCPLSWWCHPTISSSVIPFSSCLQSFPASGSFLMNRLYASGSQSTGASVSASGDGVTSPKRKPDDAVKSGMETRCASTGCGHCLSTSIDMNLLSTPESGISLWRNNLLLPLYRKNKKLYHCPELRQSEEERLLRCTHIWTSTHKWDELQRNAAAFPRPQPFPPHVSDPGTQGSIAVSPRHFRAEVGACVPLAQLRSILKRSGQIRSGSVIHLPPMDSLQINSS